MPAGRQLSAFDVPPGKSGRFCVYHDESGTDTTHDRFQLHGALLVEEARWAQAFDALSKARRGYNGRIHFVDLRDNARNPKSKFSESITRPAGDNFTAYLPGEVARRARLREPGTCPHIVVPFGSVTLVTGDPRKAAPEMKGHCEFIQLTDLLTGAVAHLAAGQARPGPNRGRLDRRLAPATLAPAARPAPALFGVVLPRRQGRVL